MLARSSAVGRSFNNLISSKLGCYSLLKLSRGSEEISEFINEKKESVLKRGWRYTERGKCRGGRGEVSWCYQSCAVQGPRSNESWKSQNAQIFYSLYAFILKL